MRKIKGSTFLILFVLIFASITTVSCKPNISKLSRKEDVDKLIEALDYKNWETRRDAAIALGDLKDLKSIDPLINIFFSTDFQSEGDYTVCRAAKNALVNIGEPVVAPLLIIQAEKQFNINAFHVLSDIGSVQALDYFISVLAVDHSKNTIERAQEALVEIGKPAIDPLISILEDSTIGSNAILVLDQLNFQPKVSPYYFWYFVRTEQFDQITEMGTDAIPPLITLLSNNNEDLDVRVKAAETLEFLGQPLDQIDELDKEVIPQLVTISNNNDENWDIRMNAAELLVLMDEPHILDTLIEWLNEYDNYDRSTIEQVHIFSTQQMGTLGDLRAVDSLLAVLKNDESELKLIENAFTSLEELGKPLISEWETVFHAFGSICSNPEGWEGIASLDVQIPEQFYPILVLSDPGDGIESGYIQSDWTALSLFSFEPNYSSSNLQIACVEQEIKLSEKCWYNGANRYRKYEILEIVLRDAETGIEIANNKFRSDDPPKCPSMLSIDDPKSETYQTRIKLDTVNTWLEEYIP